jgi:hypothetical protein
MRKHHKLLADRSQTSNLLWLHLPDVLALAGSAIAAFYVHRLRLIAEPIRDALIITFTLLLFRHLIYDFIVLLLPFAAAFGAKKFTVRAGVFTITAYFWFASSINQSADSVAFGITPMRELCVD